ncbi:hypothetical protein [Helicobacter pylori]|uniref:PBECR3 domain-containing polyvalent protein n=1 Tax=Helicobacter pylori TaxID=210 RepID=UPI00046CB0AD|nr:hypothetical protein [Helicobacter pylori]
MKTTDVTLSEDQEIPIKEQIFKRLKEATLEKINAICKEKIIKEFKSEVLGSLHAYDLTLEDQANLQALVIAGIDSVFRCAEISNGVIGFKTYKKHTKAQLLELSKQANETLKLKDNQNRPVVASFNQINGFFVVVEQVLNAKNELMLKTMYKSNGDYKDSLIYKKTLAKSQNSN